MHPMTRTRNPRRLLLTALLCALAFAACGGEDEATDARSGSEPADAADGTDGMGSGDAGAAAEAGDSVDVVDFQYKPGNLKAKAGSSVTFTNKDDFAHTVTAKDKSFDSGNMEKDAVFTQSFDKPGTYDYFCAIHNSMTGTVTVE